MKRLSASNLNRKIDSPFIFCLVLILFIASLILIFKGFVGSKNKESIDNGDRFEEVQYQEETSLSEYFEGSSFNELKDQEF